MPRNRKAHYRPRPKVQTKVKVDYEGFEKPLPIERTVQEGVDLTYSDGLLVHHREDTFYLAFLQIQYPLAVTPEELKNIESVEQRCVSQIIVTASQMAKNIKVLNTNFKKFVDKQSPEVQDLLNTLAGYDGVKTETEEEVKESNEDSDTE